MTRGSATLRPRGFAAWAGTLAAVIGLFAPSIGITQARASAPTTNNLGNPGFEQAVEPTLATGCPAVNPSSGGLGNWTPSSTSSSSTAAVRSTAQAHSGTYSGQVTIPAGGPVGGFLQQLPNLAPTDSFTMSEWVYPVASEPSGQEFTLYWGNVCNVTGVLGITVLPDRVLGGLGASAITAPPIAFNAWHNLALAVSGTLRSTTLSVDGKVAGTAPIGSVPTSSNGAWIFLGNGAGAGTPLPVADNFFYDDVSVAGLAADRASWPFDEGSGTVAHDATGNGHDGTLVGGVTWAPTSTASGVKLDGSTGYVEAANPPMVSNSITLSTAVDPAGVFGDSLGGPIIVGQYDTHDTATAYYLSLINGNHVYFSVVGPSCDSLHGADVLSVTTTSAIPAGTSTILRATFDTTNQRAHVYINDQDAGLTTSSSGTVSQICTTTTPVRIGAAEGITGLISTGFAGTIDDVNISASVECSSAGNLVCNPGFEMSLGGTQVTGAVNQSVGNWLSDHNRASGIAPDIVSTPVHSGTAAGQVQTSPGNGGAAFVQDFPTFPASTSYTLSAYVYPVTGSQQIELLFGWDRGVVGTSAGLTKIDMQPTQIAFQAWGQSAAAPVVLAAGAWHQVELFVDASSLTSTLVVDGTTKGSTSAGTGLAQSEATLWAGQEGGNGGIVPDHYYYDDFSLTLTARSADNDLALTSIPADITVVAASPAGAIVNYLVPTVNDEDISLPTVGCTPAPGSIFPVGQTTVACSATDADDTPGTATASFSVTVTPPCISKLRPSTAAYVPGESDVFGAYRLGDTKNNTGAVVVAPNSGSGPFKALGGVYANILNCSPWVENNSNGVESWVMLQEFGHGNHHMQLGWIKFANGTRTTLIELEDAVTDERAQIDAIIGQGSTSIFERCDSPSSLVFMSCAGVNGQAGSIPVAGPGTSTYYSVQFRPTKPLRQTYRLSFQLSGGLVGVINTVRALGNQVAGTTTVCYLTNIQYTPFSLTISLDVTCATPYTLEGTFLMFMQQPGQPAMQVATAPARFIPNQADVAGEIFKSYDQMPGATSSHEIFDDAHVYSNGSWVGFGGQVTFDGAPFGAAASWGPFDISCDGGSCGTAIAPSAPIGERLEIWDGRIP